MQRTNADLEKASSIEDGNDKQIRTWISTSSKISRALELSSGALSHDLGGLKEGEGSYLNVYDVCQLGASLAVDQLGSFDNHNGSVVTLSVIFYSYFGWLDAP